MWNVILLNPEGSVLLKTVLRPGVPVTIGRAVDRTIRLGSLAVGDHHGKIELRNGMPVYFDEEDSSGTLVDGQYVRGPTPLTVNKLLQIAGFRVMVEGSASPAKKPEGTVQARTVEAEAPSGAAAELLEQQLRGIRSQREEHQRQEQGRQTYIEQEWTKVVTALTQLRLRLAKEPRVLHFTISRDQQEIAVKMSDAYEKRGYSYFVLSRYHPDGQRFPGMEQFVWLREFGGEDKRYPEPQKAMAELVSRIAGKLA